MFRIKSKLIETKPFDVTREVWRVIQRRAMEAVGRYWHEHFLPDHFTRQARHKYGHEHRSRAYRRRKMRMANDPTARVRVQLGGEVDNVYSGRMMEALLSKAIVRGFPTRVRITMIGPRHMSIRFHKKRQPNKKAELITTTPDQANELQGVQRDSINKDLSKVRQHRESKL